MLVPIFGASVLMFSCGQGPSFKESGNVPAAASPKGSAAEQVSGNGDPKSAEDDVPVTIDNEGNPIPPSEGTSGGTTAGTGSGGQSTTTKPPTSKTISAGPGQVYKIPATVTDEDAASLQNCLVKWRDNLPARFAYYRRIAASVSVYGYGTSINDQLRTDGPSLILVAAAVNVGGSPVYNLQNPNGYYCIKVGVNVLTSLQVNLNCAAHLADSKVNVNVGSTVNGTTVAVGVDVMSTIKVVDSRPAGDVCIR